MKRLIIILSVIALGSFVACEKVIPLNIEYRDPRLVVNSMLQHDSIIKVNLSCSRIIIDNAEVKPVTNAVIKLYKDGEFLENLADSANGMYYSNYTAVSGSTYALKVEAEDYESVTCETTVPFSQPIISLDTSRGRTEYGEETLEFGLRFNLAQGDENYYMLRLRSEYYSEFDEDDYWYYGPEYLWINSNDVIVEAQGYDSGLMFSDRLITTDTYTLNGSTYTYFGDTVQLIFEFYYLDESMFQYFTTKTKHLDAQGNPLMEPVVVYSNVSSGMGIFGSASAVTDTIIFVPSYNYYY